MSDRTLRLKLIIETPDIPYDADDKPERVYERGPASADEQTTLDRIELLVRRAVDSFQTPAAAFGATVETAVLCRDCGLPDDAPPIFAVTPHNVPKSALPLLAGNVFGAIDKLVALETPPQPGE